MKILYYAVNGSGQGLLFTSLPERNEHRKIWVGTIEGVYCRLIMQLEAEHIISLPKITWENNPIKLELKVCLEG